MASNINVCDGWDESDPITGIDINDGKNGCTACDNLLAYDSYFEQNQVNQTVVNWLKENKGLAGLANHTNCSDVQDFINCKLKVLEYQLGIYDICDLAEWVRHYAHNQNLLDDIMHAELCGTWEAIISIIAQLGDLQNDITSIKGDINNLQDEIDNINVPTPDTPVKDAEIVGFGTSAIVLPNDFTTRWILRVSDGRQQSLLVSQGGQNGNGFVKLNRPVSGRMTTDCVISFDSGNWTQNDNSTYRIRLTFSASADGSNSNYRDIALEHLRVQQGETAGRTIDIGGTLKYYMKVTMETDIATNQASTDWLGDIVVSLRMYKGSVSLFDEH